ncbi:hypothetical protein ANN_08873 [Periplaneta americana]|uniref:Uncharacterized protein n=1 Tax=Periplaneta americana TaxID=6978 RepID=A0ABQ8T2M1_PERAM|nr:hypothetical protein ANN_08873 [Periplaneta americana]
MHHEVQSSVSSKKKEETRAALITHKIRAKKFYKMLKENSNTLCLDLQQVQSWPKLQITMLDRLVSAHSVLQMLRTNPLTFTSELKIREAEKQKK